MTRGWSAPKHDARHAEAAQVVVEGSALGRAAVKDDDVVFGTGEGSVQVLELL